MTRRIWAQPLGTDPVLRNALRSPVSGERLCEVILDLGTPRESIGWLIRNKAGSLVFSNSVGAIRTVDAADATRAMAAMEGAETKLGKQGHSKIDNTRLRELLDEVGYSQSSFAREWGVTNRNVRRWCNRELDVPLWVGKVLEIMSTYHIAPLD